MADACKGVAGAIERVVESTAKSGHQISGGDVLNGLWGAGVSQAEGLANIKAFTECNNQRRQADPHVPHVSITPG